MRMFKKNRNHKLGLFKSHTKVVFSIYLFIHFFNTNNSEKKENN